MKILVQNSFYSKPVPEFFMIQNIISFFNFCRSMFSFFMRDIVWIDLAVSRIFIVYMASINVLLRVK